MIAKSLFGSTPEGNEVNLYRIINSTGSELSVINYGGIIQSLKVPDKHNVFTNVVLGYNTLTEYLGDKHYMGAVVGRYANRIANGVFSIDDVSYKLCLNDRGNHLHGGLKGFNRVIWNAEIISDNAVKLSYKSRDGEEGYPGNLLTEVIYTLTNSNELRIDFYATTDKATIVNLMQHSYFNLSGRQQTILNHELTINAVSYLPVTNTMIPTGEICSVENTPFDFTLSKNIGSRLTDSHLQLQYGKGYDHCWAVNHPKRGINKVATLMEPISGRKMEVFTDKPGLHVYSGNFLSENFKLHAGICLETQHFPDAPNQIHFPTAVLRPVEQYASTTIFKFSIGQQ